MNWNKYAFLIAILLQLVSCVEVDKNKSDLVTNNKESATTLPYFNSAIFTPEWDKGNHKIPEFSFRNQNGELVNNETFVGKIYVADFFFTICPGICPKLTKNMGMLQAAYQDDPDIKLLSHSVMPWNDTVDKLNVYAKQNGVKLPQWHLVTGDTEAIYDIARNGYFADEDFTKTQKPSNFIHTENFILVDKQGYIRGVYNGTLPLEVKRLMRHIEILKKEL
ncbi:SCO family protein [Maribacter algarum]|uniref:SCO family protein n=1 Tax=Maribacter algarum (ex Zhang et al. 2020) TaxID=2578118 RepID=A0A5S3PHI6_9FLAO|nr:SCO family protein [Maribacter algarum]TMM53707.1 SCO family protein [Maribacter algarum]